MKLSRTKLLAIVIAFVIIPLTAGKGGCSTQSAWGKASAGNVAPAGGVLVKVGTFSKNGKRIGKFIYYGSAIVAAWFVAHAIQNSIMSKDPCLVGDRQYVVAKFPEKNNAQTPYLTCGTLYPYMRANQAPYSSLAFNIGCIDRVIANGTFSYSRLTANNTERWQWHHYHVVVRASDGWIKRYKCT